MKNYGFLVLIIALLCAVACSDNSPSSQYNRMVAEGLASSDRQDSLFLGIHLGMSSDDFYDHCWKLNKKGLCKHGNGNRTVEYIIKDLKSEVRMNFYPVFHEEKIYKMPVTFNYSAWAPWNKELAPDKLQLEIKDLLTEWYGKEFLEVNHPQKGKVYVSVAGNRQIMIGTSDKDVRVMMTDLLVEKELEKTPISTQ